MIKTNDGKTTARGSKEELLADFAGTAESLLRKTTITAEELYEAVKIAEKAAELITAVGEFFDAFEVPNAEDEPAETEEKPNAKKGAVKATELEADDLKGMLEWLKGELENLEEEADD
ncbi:MAG: hypothetical protein ACI4J9_05095 [Mogibacterium kristiansenii]|uniref:hypothetical protein n=1 Tax=Mogibacterium kristiansenii TaxID=2606708 RepID=UPI003F116F30